MCKVHHLHQPTWPCLHDLVVVLCIFYLNINQFVQKSKENLFLFEGNRKDWLKITSLMFAYGSQIIEGKDRAQIYIEGKKKIICKYFICVHKLIYIQLRFTANEKVTGGSGGHQVHLEKEIRTPAPIFHEAVFLSLNKCRARFPV